MLPFVTSHAIALSQAKQKPGKSPASSQQSAAPRTGKGFFSRLFDAMVDARMRQAKIELARYRRLPAEAPKK